MIKEFKYLFFILIICLFLFFILKYYFSDQNKKESYRSLSKLPDKLEMFENELPVLINDTNNIIEFIEKNNDIDKKNFKFWELLNENN